MDSTHPTLEAKVDWLSRPEAFPDSPSSVDVVETHFAWVFLSRRFAYKLKKPIRSDELDFTTLGARRANCELEIAVNRRLAAPVYIGVVPLVVTAGELALEGTATPVEWLVKMRRLPEAQMLDRRLAAGPVSDAAFVPLLDKLGAFYAHTARAPWDGPVYRHALERGIERCTAELAADNPRVETIRAALARFVEQRRTLLDARIAARRIVDAHGDLRPEHVCLRADPQIIDALEFSAELRLLDTAAEIAFLALESERIAGAAAGARLVELYRRRCEDAVEPELVAFYRAVRALVRAMLTARHLRAPSLAEAAAETRSLVRWYLDHAAAALGLAAGAAEC